MCALRSESLLTSSRAGLSAAQRLMTQFPDSIGARCWFTAGALALGLAACGGGGDDSPDSSGASAQLTGVLGLLQTDSVSLENEPNGTVEQAHILGSLVAGQTRSVVGSVIDTNDDDIFQVVAPERVRIDIALDAMDAGSNLDVFIFDPVGLQQVATFASTNASEAGSFVAQGTFFVLVEADSGSSDYELSFTATGLGASIDEMEPNDGAFGGEYLGTFGSNDQLTFTGDGADPGSDFIVLAVPEATTLNAGLLFDAGEDYDLFFFDVTADIGSPSLLGSVATNNVPEVGQVMVNAMTLVAIEIRPISGASSAYTLDLEGSSFLLGTDGAGDESTGEPAGGMPSPAPAWRSSVSSCVTASARTARIPADA